MDPVPGLLRRGLPGGLPEPALAVQQGQQTTDGDTTPPDAALLGGAGAADALSRP
jgi:hypothetical protein